VSAKSNAAAICVWVPLNIPQPVSVPSNTPFLFRSILFPL
jgi:hypothetical protein